MNNVLTQNDVDSKAGAASGARLNAAMVVMAAIAAAGLTADEKFTKVIAAHEAGDITAEEMDQLNDSIEESIRLNEEQGNEDSDSNPLSPEEMRSVHLAEQLDGARAQVSELQVAFIASLPIATDAQYAIVAACAADEAQAPEGYKQNADFRLSKEQEAALAKVRKARIAFLSLNKADYLTAMSAEEQKLTSYKVRVGSKKTTTSMRFERSMGNVQKKASNGYVAQLRAKAGL